MMREGGMDPMGIIVASTRTAAEVCGLGRILGTLERERRLIFWFWTGIPFQI